MVPFRALAVVGALGVEASQVQLQRGEKVHCVQDRAHLLRFEVLGAPNNGTSLEGIERALVSLEPSPAHGELCSSIGEVTPSGDKEFCYGANQDASCTAAATELPINDYFSCKDCFISVAGDAFYKLDYTVDKLHSLQAGLNDVHLRASASLHSLLQGDATVATGTIPVFGTDALTVIDTLVGCPICVKVKITVAAPTSIDYDLKVSGEVDLQAGVALDVNLGNNFVSYDYEAGWSHSTDQPVVTTTPLLAASLNAEADFNFGLNTQLQVNIDDDLFWYHLTLNPSIPGQLTFSGDLVPAPTGKLCLDGTAKFTMTQEADLNWNLLVTKVKDHWGPSTLWSWQLPSEDEVHFCKELGSSSAAVVV